MKKKWMLVLIFTLFVFSSAQAATTIVPAGVSGQWLATGQFDIDKQLFEFEVTTVGLPYQIYTNITDNDDLDTVLAIYDLDGDFITAADDSSNLNPSLFTLFAVGETYLLKFGLYDAFHFDDGNFDLLVGPFDPYDFTLSFVNASPVEVDTMSPVPVPTALLLLGSGLLGLAGLRRRQ